MVTNRETGLATELFAGFSLWFVLTTLPLCSPNCSSGRTKHDILAAKVDTDFAPATAFEPTASSFSVLVLVSLSN